MFIDNECRSRAIWEQPVCPECPEPSGRPISYGRTLECAIVKVKPYGYVKWEIYFDTRQPLGTREENSLFFPARCLSDIYRQDINAHGKWHMTAFETRVGLELIGPEWEDVKTDGLVEGDFRGIVDATISDFRLRMPSVVCYGKIVFFFLANGGIHFGYLNVSLILLALLLVLQWIPRHVILKLN